MLFKSLIQNMALGSLAYTQGMALCTRNEPLRVESFVNVGIGGFRTVSSLIIGSQSAVLIDMPLTLPAANELAGWIKNTTDKPLVAAFATHHHVDHYLGASAILAEFPEAIFYATQKNVDLIAFEVGPQVLRLHSLLERQITRLTFRM